MKRTVFFLLICLLLKSKAGFAQTKNILQQNNRDFKYLLLNDRPDNNIVIKKIDVESSNNFGCNPMYKAELYNMFLGRSGLVLFTVFPSGSDHLPHWKKISLDSIKSRLLFSDQLGKLYDSAFSAFSKSGFKNYEYLKNDTYKLILKKEDGYYTNATDCFAEFFNIINSDHHATAGLTGNNYLSDIDIELKPTSIASFEINYKERNGSYSHNIGDESSIAVNGEQPTLFYSNSLILLNKKSYFFWTYAHWYADAINSFRGIDRFIFNPEYGIVAGDYSFYFSKLTGSKNDLCRSLVFYRYMCNELNFMPIKVTTLFQLK